MSNVILVGCDLHDATLVLVVGVGAADGKLSTHRNTPTGRHAMVAQLKTLAQKNHAERIVFAYEASGLGFGLWDELTAVDIECYVLAPSKIPHAPGHKKRKNDSEDAKLLWGLLKAHVLAGNELPSVWIPPQQIRDDRELVRTRIDQAQDVSRAKTQVRALLKRNGVELPQSISNWTFRMWRWLNELAYTGSADDQTLDPGACRALLTHLRRLVTMERELERLERALEQLSMQPRWSVLVSELTKVQGVGRLSALVFLTEIGDVTRFRNRQQVGSYLGLVPSSFESGQVSDRKGHITRMGSHRLRKVLCQCVWSRLRWDKDELAHYRRICERNPKKNKIGIVALMRRLGVLLWHRAMAALLAQSPPGANDANRSTNDSPQKPRPQGRDSTSPARAEPRSPRSKQSTRKENMT